MGSTAVAALIRREKQIVEAFRMANATSPDRAVTMEAIGMHERLAFRKLRNRAVLREAAPGYFYLDDERWNGITKLRRIMVALAIAAALIGTAIGVFAA